jgi:hypothetical protein
VAHTQQAELCRDGDDAGCRRRPGREDASSNLPVTPSSLDPTRLFPDMLLHLQLTGPVEPFFLEEPNRFAPVALRLVRNVTSANPAREVDVMTPAPDP